MLFRSDADEEPHAIVGGEVLLLRVLGEMSRAGDVLHREVGHSHAVVDVRARLVDLRDAGMTQASEQLRFVQEATVRRASRRAGAKHLERDGANEVVILRLEHRAHAAGGDDALQSVKARASLRLRRERFPIAGTARREEVGDGDVTAAGFHLKRALELREQLFSGLALRADFALLFGLELNHCGTGFGLLRVHVT